MFNSTQLKEVVDKALVTIPTCSSAPRLTEPVKYILSIGGKRIRPVLALMACNLFTDKIENAVMPATGLEVFHNFTLVHDDIMDKAPLRRSLATVHVKWDTNQAILSGDVMAFIANECFLQAPESSFMKIFRVFNKSAAEVCEGQQLDMEFEKMPVISEDDYLKMIRLKTAVLIASSLKIGAYLGDASEQDAESLYEFGINLGLAFQIEDDILDIWGDTKIFGKAHGGDIAAGKKTYPFIKAMDLASPAEKRELKKLYTGRQSDIDSILSRVIAIYDSLNIREKCEVTSGEYNRKAFSCLEKVSVDPARKNELTTLASSLIGRVY